MSTPSPAEKALKRIVTISLLNGWSVAVIAGIGTLLALALGDLLGAFIGLLAVVAGWMEIRGNGKLRRRDPAGLKWLVRAQLFLLTVILAYCASRLGSYDEEVMLANLTPDMEALLQEAGIGRADVVPLVRMAFYGLYGTVAVMVGLYQGGLALYYRSRVKVVTEALTARPAV